MKKVHLIGMGGIGMSALAQLLLARGVRVRGSDTQDSELLGKIRRLGGTLCIGHRAANLDHPEIVVYSSSISPANPELVAARNRGIPVVQRGQFLARLVSGRKTVAVAGSHGKSTTSAWITHLLVGAGRDPLAALGAEVDALGGNARTGKGSTAVVEADESDNSFLWLDPAVAVVTNVDEEHLDYFRNRREVEEAYAAFVGRLAPDGTLIACQDDPGARRLLRGTSRRRIGYGLSKEAHWRATDVRCEAGGSRYRCARGGRTLGWVQIQVPGLHNVLNSLAVLAAADVLGIEFRRAEPILREYKGARRRFQVHGEARGLLVVEDYGHHPAEVAVTLATARTWKGRRVRCVFQPHRYSRTRYLLERFGTAFKDADELILLPVYAASEEPMKGATSEELAAVVRKSGRKKVLLKTPDQALDYLRSTGTPQDLVLFLGAGNVGSMAGKFFKSQSVHPELVEGRIWR